MSNRDRPTTSNTELALPVARKLDALEAKIRAHELARERKAPAPGGHLRLVAADGDLMRSDAKDVDRTAQ